MQAREVARNAVLWGGLAATLGLALLLAVFFIPSREGAPASSKARLAGLALMPLAYGLPRVRAGVARLRNRGARNPLRSQRRRPRARRGLRD
jgi:hypothetical protein